MSSNNNKIATDFMLTHNSGHSTISRPSNNLNAPHSPEHSDTLNTLASSDNTNNKDSTSTNTNTPSPTPTATPIPTPTTPTLTPTTPNFPTVPNNHTTTRSITTPTVSSGQQSITTRSASRRADVLDEQTISPVKRIKRAASLSATISSSNSSKTSEYDINDDMQTLSAVLTSAPVQLSAQGASCRGHKRPMNQDGFVCRVFGESLVIFGVFDGHGSLGHEAARRCQTLLPSLIANFILIDNKTPQLAIKDAFREVQQDLTAEANNVKGYLNDKILAATKSTTRSTRITVSQHATIPTDDISFDFGTTACICVTYQGILYIANLGDSRCVVFKKTTEDSCNSNSISIKHGITKSTSSSSECVLSSNSTSGLYNDGSTTDLHAVSFSQSHQLHHSLQSCKDWTIVFTTVDHVAVKNNKEYERVLRAGGGLHQAANSSKMRVFPGDISYEEAKKKKLSLNISRALGHIKLSQYGVSAEPEISEVIIDSTSDSEYYIVVGSDGLWDVMSNYAVQEIVTQRPTDVVSNGITII
jgi:serine/threonine protein phosphatase PrpC